MRLWLPNGLLNSCVGISFRMVKYDTIRIAFVWLANVLASNRQGSNRRLPRFTVLHSKLPYRFILVQVTQLWSRTGPRCTTGVHVLFDSLIFQPNSIHAHYLFYI